MMERQPHVGGIWHLAVVCALAGTLAGCAMSRESRLAADFEKSGNWDGAIILYEEALKNSPDDLELRAKLDAARIEAAAIHFQRGQELLKTNQVESALDELKRALSYDASRPEYRAAFDRAARGRDALIHLEAGRQLTKAGRLDEALREFQAAQELNPGLTEAEEALLQIAQRQQLGQSAEELALTSTEPITIKFQNARIKEVFELLSKSYGVNILFDRDVRDDNVTVFIRDASFQQALSLILATNNLFMKRINERTILVIPKTKAKANQYEDLQIRTFYLSVTPAKDMVNLLRTMLDTRRVFVNNEMNAIVMRDSPDKLELASKIISANDRQVAEVMFEVEIIEVSRTKLLKYGWQFQPGNTVQAGLDSGTGDAVTLSLDTLKNLTEGNVFLTLPSVVVDLIKQDSEAQTLANPRIRVLSGNNAKINIGDKVPILLSTSTSTATTSTTTGGATTTTSTEFKDVGIKLNIDPVVHLNNDVQMKLSLEVSTLGEFVDQANQFRFGNRTAETVLNVHDGETVVIGGLIRDEDRLAENKIPVLGDIPILGKLFSGTDKQKIKSDVILTITPHVVRRLEPPSEELVAFWSGTEEAYSTAPLFSGLSFGGVPSEGGGEFVAPPPEPFQPQVQPQVQPDEGNTEVPVPSPPVPPSPVRPTPPFSSGTYLPEEGPAASQAVLHMVPDQLVGGLGEEFVVTVRADHSSVVSGAELSIEYDADVLEFLGAKEGDLLARDGWATGFDVSANPDAGRIDLRLSRLSDELGVRNSGVLCTLVFSGKSVGASTISILEGHLTGPAHDVLPASLRRGVVVVR